MKRGTTKRIFAIILILIIVLTLGGCEREKTILGEWKYDTSENTDPDLKGITVNITDDVMYLKNSIDGEEITMDVTYEKDENTIYATGVVINGKNIGNGEEGFFQIPYTLLDENLILDLNDAELGKIIFSRAD